MISRAVWVLVAITGCSRDSPSSREQVLEMIPPTATAILTAEGRALAHPRIRPVVEVLRHELPASLGCVIDTALAGEHVAIGLGEGVTVAVAARGTVRCPALSKIGNRLHVATVGGSVASGDSVLSSGELARARPYLLEAPIAAYISARQVRVLATAQADPLAAWVAFDTVGIDAELVETLVEDYVKRLGGNVELAPFTAAVEISRQGPQVIVRLDAKVDADLAVAVKTALAFHRAQVGRSRPVFECPAIAPPLQRCTVDPCSTPIRCSVERLVLEVASSRAALALLVAARVEPVVRNARVEGLRVRDDVPALGIRAGDVVLAVDGRRVMSGEQLVGFVRSAGRATSIEVSRLGRLGTIELRQER